VGWHDQEEARFRAVGGRLRNVVTPDQWQTMTEDERAGAVTRVVERLREEMKIEHETPVEWSDDPDDEGLGYDEKTGTLVIPRRHLVSGDPVALVPAVAQEVRHAWQLDVIEGRTEHPLGEVARTALAQALANYTAENPVYYTSNELELDAEMVEVAVRQGYAPEAQKRS
jgi:hypothetical protein